MINVHYLSNHIIEYLNKKKFNLKITIINEKEKILDTGGGILNALKYFDESFLCINPDTIWNLDYLKELEKMKKNFSSNNNKCYLLLVDKKRSFDKNLKGDFNLEKFLVKKDILENSKYIFDDENFYNDFFF